MYFFPFQKIYTPFYHTICNFSKNLKNLTCWEKTEARFGSSTEKLSGNNISHSMNR